VPETTHINADDLLGLLCLALVHARVRGLAAAVAEVGDFVAETAMIEREGFYLTSLQAALHYALTADIAARARRCGHCEAADAARECRACGRRLCAACDALLHEHGGGGGGGDGARGARRRALAAHERFTG